MSDSDAGHADGDEARGAREHTAAVLGQMLFVVSAPLFVAAGVRAGDGLALAGSVVLLVAGFVFLHPLTRR